MGLASVDLATVMGEKLLSRQRVSPFPQNANWKKHQELFCTECLCVVSC